MLLPVVSQEQPGEGFDSMIVDRPGRIADREVSVFGGLTKGEAHGTSVAYVNRSGIASCYRVEVESRAQREIKRRFCKFSAGMALGRRRLAAKECFDRRSWFG